MSRIERKCETCPQTFMARSADVKRGWGRFCSKRCKAIEQERRTGQYQRLQEAHGPTMDPYSPYYGLHDYGTTHGQDPEDGF